MRFLPAAAHRPQPWKNGLGVSRVIADDPVGAGFDALGWQVSATEIAADCPFSALPGLDRLFVVIGGAGVELSSLDERGERKVAVVRPGEAPHAFRGDWVTQCRLLAGPVRVLNVIARRGAFEAALRCEASGRVDAALGEIVVAIDPASLDAWIIDAGQVAPTAVGREPWVARIRAKAGA